MMTEQFLTPFASTVGTILLGLAITHTFLTNYFKKVALRFPEGSIAENFFHLLGEVEIVFGLWSGVLFFVLIFHRGWEQTLSFIDRVNFSEPIFVFAIMTIAATKPIINSARNWIIKISNMLPNYRLVGMYFLTLTIGPLLGSFITEPAAMTVTALIILTQFFSQNVSEKFRYVTIAVLFVNISIGGVLTNYAAPPVLMIADQWGWSTKFMFFTFGWKAVVSILINTSISTAYLFKELRTLEFSNSENKIENKPVPSWLVMVHILFLILVVICSHHPAMCMGALLFFLGITTITREYQEELKIRESLLVAFFLAGLVVLGQFQSWWLTPLLSNLNTFPLFLGSTALTAITDNAALTYLGSQVPNVSEAFKYALVAGAVAGGGLTVIANAPNPAGYSILQESFGKEGIHPGKLFIHALIPTLIAMFCFWVL